MTTMTERQRMLAGDLYLASDPELVAMRLWARRICREYNATLETDAAARDLLLHELFGAIGEGACIEPDFRCDYGCFIRAGRGLFMNFGCVILDCTWVTIGDGVLLGPGVHIYAATHPTDPVVRAAGRESARPVIIGNNVWIGGGAIICPGVTVGNDAVIGAGAVVTKDVDAGAIVGGNPARGLRAR